MNKLLRTGSCAWPHGSTLDRHPSWGSEALMCTVRTSTQRCEEPDRMPKWVSGCGWLPGGTGAMGGTGRSLPALLHAADDLEFNNLMSAVQLPALLPRALSLLRKMQSYRSSHMLEVILWPSLLSLFPLSVDEQRGLRDAGSHLALHGVHTEPPCPACAGSARQTAAAGAALTLSESKHLQHPASPPPQLCEGERMGAGAWFLHLLDHRHSLLGVNLSWDSRDCKGAVGVSLLLHCLEVWHQKGLGVTTTRFNLKHTYAPDFSVCVLFWCEYSSRQGCRRVLSRFSWNLD